MTRMAGLIALATRHAAAAADGHEDRVQVGLGFQDLQRVRRHPGDQPRLVAGRHKAQPLVGLQRQTVTLARVEVGPVKDDLRAIGAHGRDLNRVGVLRHDDHRAHAEEPRGIGNGLAVIARRRGDDAALASGVVELSHEVDAAAHLEGPDGVIVLVLEIDFRPDQPVQRRIMMQGRGRQIRADEVARRQHIGKGRRALSSRCHGVFPAGTGRTRIRKESRRRLV